jgi:xanthine dehydrogenase small subunit
MMQRDNLSKPLRFWRNGKLHHIPAPDPNTTLLELLRDPTSPPGARCNGTKEGCAEGDCGACTVVIGEPSEQGLRLRAINSCIRLAHSIDGCALWTVQDIGRHSLHPVQKAMIDAHASQCGFCTPGFIMSLFALYHTEQTAPTREKAQEVLGGNLCRCTGYRPILDAAQAMGRYPRVELDTASISDQLAKLEPAEEVGSALRPGTLEQALQWRRQWPEAQVIAGCTDVGLWITKQHQEFARTLDVTGIDELRGIETAQGMLRIGAAARLTEVFSALQHHWPALEHFGQRFAGLPIRNSATLGGNIANGSPIGDSMPALIALGAQVVLANQDQQRSLPLEDFYLGYRKTSLAPDELVIRIDVPLPMQGSRFFRTYKLSKRFDDDISAVCLGLNLEFDAGTVRSARFGVGGMAAVPSRARAAEHWLTGRPWTLDIAQQAGMQLAAEFSPMSDMRATASYRSEAISNLLIRAYWESKGFHLNLEQGAGVMAQAQTEALLLAQTMERTS